MEASAVGFRFLIVCIWRFRLRLSFSFIALFWREVANGDGTQLMVFSPSGNAQQRHSSHSTRYGPQVAGVP